MEEINNFATQFFVEEKPLRDGSGRPLLVPRGVEVVEENRVPYTRASSLGDVLEDHFHLWRWKMRGLAKGLADSPDLVRLIAAETYTCGFADDERENRAAGRRIDEAIERAMDRAGISVKADYGTAIHLRTEPDNLGTDPDDKQEADVESCYRLWAELGVVHLGTEVFTANDDLYSAGTFDHLSYIPDMGILVTDKKTSAKVKASYDVQLASYAHSDIYDKDTDQRMTLEEYVEAQGWNPALIDRSHGIIWWVKGGRTQARILNLDDGYQAARVAAWVRDNRHDRVAPDVTSSLLRGASTCRDYLLQAITDSPTLEALNQLWANPECRAVWTEEHTAAAIKRREAL